MKKLITLILLLSCALTVSAQKLSKEEKAAIAKASYEKALTAMESKNFIIVPASYTEADGMIESNTDNSCFILCEGKNVFLQGKIVCDNNSNNIAEATEYTMTTDKKGNIRLKIIVLGRMVKGTYNISVRANTNTADVIFNPQSGGTTRKFSGPVTIPAETSYNKRSNPI